MHRQRRASISLVLLAIGLVAIMFWSLTVGAASPPVLPVVASWLGMGDPAGVRPAGIIILEQIRLPRIIMGAIVGASLAVSGAILQGLFRNPLADPTIVGVSAGAILGAVTVIVLGATVFPAFTKLAGAFAIPVAAFSGALAVAFLLYRLATRSGQTSVATLLLAGIAINAFGIALTGILIFLADDAQLRELTFWSLGSLAGATWEKVFSGGLIMLVSMAAVPFVASALNALSLGEAAAGHMGIDVQKMKNISILCAAGATGAAVAVSGGIGFIGIIVPHLLRISLGPDNRFLLPAAALLGGILLVLADSISRTIVAPTELPIGIVTALAGAPVFISILLRRRNMIEL